MRALLYLNLDPEFQEPNLIDANGPAPDADRFQPLVEKIEGDPVEQTEKMSWGFDPANSEVLHALPLVGRQKELLGVLFVGSSQKTVVSLERRIRWLALGVAAVGLLLGLLLSWWGAARVTRPVQKLASAAREVSQGNWNAHVDVHGGDEVGQLAKSFNQMTTQLVEQREKLVQVERVAAWRELARRLAHELKNPLFPLQTTVENLQRAREQHSDQFDEVFRESTRIMLGEIDNLKAIVTRFSDFAKMPQPELAPVNLNEIVRNVVKLFEAQFNAVGRPPISPELHLAENLPSHPGRRHIVASRDRESGSQRDGRDAGGRRADAPHPDHRARRLARSFRYRFWPDARRIRTHFYSLLHLQAARLRPSASPLYRPWSPIMAAASRSKANRELVPLSTSTCLRTRRTNRKYSPWSSRRKKTRRNFPCRRKPISSSSMMMRIRSPRSPAPFVSPVTTPPSAITPHAPSTSAKADHFDLILSDVVMPGRDGIALLEDFKAAGINSTIVMMSGQASIEMAVKATRLGASDFLEKPISTDKLLLTVENVLRLKHLERKIAT